MKKENYTKDLLMQGSARILGGGITFVALFIFTYIFSEEELGQYNLIFSSISIITSLITLWLTQSILKFYSDSKEELGNVIIISIILSCLACMIYYSMKIILRNDIFLSEMLYVVLLILYNVFDVVFRKERKLKSYVFLELSMAISKIFPMILIDKYFKLSYNSIFISQIIVVMIYFVILIIINRKILFECEFKIDKSKLMAYWKYGFPLIGLALSNWFLTTSDRYIINYFCDVQKVGIYSTDYSLANSIYMMFALIIINAFHPILMKKWKISKEETIALLSKILDLYFLFMIPILFYGCLKSKVLLSLFKGENYANHFGIFNWTAIGIFVYGLSLIYHKYYEFTEKTKMILYINIFVSMLNIILNILMIPKFGFEISAFTTFLAYVMYILIVRLKTFNNFKIKFKFKNLFIITSASLIFYLVDLIFVKNTNIMGFFIEGIVYVIYMLIVYYVTDILKNMKVEE